MRRFTAFALWFALLCAAAPAQTPAAARLEGTVSSSDGTPIAGATVFLNGALSRHTATTSNGAFSFTGLPAGTYRVTVTKASFRTERRDDVTVPRDAAVRLTIELAPESFSSLRQIGSVSVSANQTINTSPAAVSVMPAQSMIDQGMMQVTHALNEIPGIVASPANFSNNPNGALPIDSQIPMIRGGLPYETASLIDGHPIAVGSNGYFTPIYLSPYVLQNIEVVKGPGAMPPEIMGAVNGTVNYRTLEPTRTFEAAATFDTSTYGGVSGNYRVSGTTPGRLGYVVDYGYFNEQGPVNSTAYGGTLQQTATLINGVPICGPHPPGSCVASPGPAVYPPNTIGAISLGYPIVICCDHLQSDYVSHYELAKLRYDFSPQTSLLTSYLGGRQNQFGSLSYELPSQYFQPPPGYSGSLPPGVAVPLATLAFDPDHEQAQQGLFQTELRTALNNGTLLLRYYSGAQLLNAYNYPAGQGYTFSGQVWGGLPIGPGGSEQYFNGQTETFTQDISGIDAVINDHFSGYSAELDLPDKANLYTFSLDRTHEDSYAYNAGTTIIPQGASQAYLTFLARATLALSAKATLEVGNYFVNYTTHFTPDGGTTWGDVSHSFYGPRAALLYQPATGTALRFSAGSSIAPPYLLLVNTPGGPPIANNQGAPSYYTQLQNNGNLSPETAFGVDIGADRRFGNATIVSGDVYETTLHGQYFTTTQPDGTYTAPSGFNIGKTLPLYLQQSLNLGQARYAGVELSIRSEPRTGPGFIAQGALMRGYTYNLPPGFYNTGAGQNTTNLAIVPYVNYYGSGNGYNGASPSRLPYAQGYGEINFRTARGALFRIGATYYGPNNSYNAPAFFVYSASARFPLGSHTDIQLSGDNLTGALSSSLPLLFGGVPEPLVGGYLGATAAVNYGPPLYRLTLTQHVGPSAGAR